MSFCTYPSPKVMGFTSCLKTSFSSLGAKPPLVRPFVLFLSPACPLVVNVGTTGSVSHQLAFKPAPLTAAARCRLAATLNTAAQERSLCYGKD